MLNKTQSLLNFMKYSIINRLFILSNLLKSKTKQKLRLPLYKNVCGEEILYVHCLEDMKYSD